jgi:hypothetical protein
MNDMLELKNPCAASDEAEALPRETDVAETRKRSLRRRDAFALLLADARRDAREYVENYTAGRGAE